MSKTLTIQIRKPRNPFVDASHQRHAGAHCIGAGGQRQHEKRSLRREITRLEPSRHSP